MDWTQFATPIIVATIPILVIGFKKVIPAKFSFLYPMIASALGPALDFIVSKSAGMTASPGKGLLMGMAAVALREVIDQIKKIGQGPTS